MLNEPTVEKLKTLRLHAMAEAWAQQQAQPTLNSLSFDERFGLLVDAEWLARENARLSRAMKEAKLRMSSACVEDIEYAAKRELDKPLIRQLASLARTATTRVVSRIQRDLAWAAHRE